MGLVEELQDETAEVLSTLLRFRTVNPPGDERACQEWLAGYLSDAGLEVELHGAEPERPNLVARHRPPRAATARCSATSRTSTRCLPTPRTGARPVGRRAPRRVPVRARRGRHEGPDGGGGRRALPGSRAPARACPARLKLISVVDEETGGVLGAKWITEERPDARARRLSASTRAPARSCPTAPAACTASAWPRRARSASACNATGIAAHASVPGLAENALLKLAPAIARLGDGPPRLRPHGAQPRAARGARRGSARPGGRARAHRGGRAGARAAARRRDERDVRAHDRRRPARRST